MLTVFGLKTLSAAATSKIAARAPEGTRTAHILIKKTNKTVFKPSLVRYTLEL
jgi:hypothetical protein